MAPNPRAVKALKVMKEMGISEGKVKPVLKNLLKLFNNNWQHIEEENYRALADAIFENDEAEAAEHERSRNAELKEKLEEEAPADSEIDRPPKRSRSKYQGNQPTPSFNNSSRLLGRPEEEREQPNSSYHLRLRGRVKTTASPQTLSGRKRSVPKKSTLAVSLKEPKTERGIELLPKLTSTALDLIKHKDEPVTDDTKHIEVPVPVIHPEAFNREDFSDGKSLTREQDACQPLSVKCLDGKDTANGISDSADAMRNSREWAKIPNKSTSLEIASTPCGEVKISLNCDLAARRPEFHTPSLNSVLKYVEDKYQRYYKLLVPNFSVVELMKCTCECFLELGTECIDESEDIVKGTSKDSPKKALAAGGGGGVESAPCILNCSADAFFDYEVVMPQLGEAPPCSCLGENIQPGLNATRNSCESNEENKLKELNSLSLETIRGCQSTDETKRSLSDVLDVAKGQEKIVISVVNEVNSELLPSFHYIPQNVVYENAYLNFSLARLGDNQCCSACLGDCLSLPTPCACSHETGGEFAYTREGLVKEELLEECISMNREPEKHCQFFCKECPLERSKSGGIAEPCKGHLVRNFIKECWWKCGCNKLCGNRVVQRGITHRLQVFMTPGGKGWGLRTLEDLPKGAFVCEYVGEVLTNAELFDRISGSTKGEKHSYPVLLDADWGSEGVLKDDEALCLDATYFGNIARFINHRCYDSNLVEIPVEIETPDHHYYHLAFFTTRKVKALEELTWDYGIDFDDIDHPVKAFHCQCGSRFCRSIKRRRRSRR